MKTEKEIAQEDRVNEIWLDRYRKDRFDNEDLHTWMSRTQHEQKMLLLWNMLNMFEGKADCEGLVEQAEQRYKYYNDLYNQGKYER